MRSRLIGALLFVAGVLHVPISALTAAIAALIAIAVSARFAVRSAQSRLGIADASTDDPAYQPAYRDQPEHDA